MTFLIVSAAILLCGHAISSDADAEFSARPQPWQGKVGGTIAAAWHSIQVAYWFGY